MVVAQLQSGRHAGTDAAEMAQHALANRLQRLEAGAALRRMDADHLGVGVIHGDDDAGDAVSSVVIATRWRQTVARATDQTRATRAKP